MPLAGRTTISFLSTFTKDHLVVDAHCGGMIGARIKLAGYDAIIVEGKSDKPVYLHIKDDQVEIKDASFVWGMGTRATTETLNTIEGNRACVATIGPAGENLLPYAVMMNSRNHSAGAGLGTIMGSKKLKALVVEGNGSVNVTTRKAPRPICPTMLREIVGSNNNHVVPSHPAGMGRVLATWAPCWTARAAHWADAEGELIETGEPGAGRDQHRRLPLHEDHHDEGPRPRSTPSR